MKLFALIPALLAAISAPAVEPAPETGPLVYELLATNKTSTLEKELNAAGAAGFRLVDMKGGETLGGDEVVAVLSKPSGGGEAPPWEYLVLATNKTSTMQKELAAAGEQGFIYLEQTVSQTAFGGQEVVVVLGRRAGAEDDRYDYRLLATKRTKTMNKEINEAASEGFQLLRLSVSRTAFAGQELVAVMMRGR